MQLYHLELFFSKLKKYGMCMNVYKFQFSRSTNAFFRFKISAAGIQTLPDRVKSTQEIPQLSELNLDAI